MYLGLEAMNANNIPVYTMPRMEKYLIDNGPWSQLVKNNNIERVSLQNDSTVIMHNNLKVTPILVPHRDEYSETVGYKLKEKINQHFLFQT
jgi:pyrroloquinoline quinone biosynthesis protein B